tara:strand:- start:174 stop:407 length:234 start_codon:yes stop_codon:yes gene_type:complete
VIEVAVSISVALVTGLGFVTTRTHSRILDLDKRIDGVELAVARDYVPRSDLAAALERVESHMIRIEQKLDNLANKAC